MSEENESRRTVQFHFRATADEAKKIHERMQSVGVSGLGAYLRKTAMDGYLIQLDLSEVKELISLIRRCSANINQLTRYCHSVGGVLASDVAYLRTQLDALWSAVNEILKLMAALR